MDIKLIFHCFQHTSATLCLFPRLVRQLKELSAILMHPRLTRNFGTLQLTSSRPAFTS